MNVGIGGWCIIKEKPQQAALKGAISLGGGVRRRGKTGKLRKVGVKRNGKQKAVTHGGARVINHPTRRETQGASTIKGWEDKRNRGHIPDTFM